LTVHRSAQPPFSPTTVILNDGELRITGAQTASRPLLETERELLAQILARTTPWLIASDVMPMAGEPAGTLQFEDSEGRTETVLPLGLWYAGVTDELAMLLDQWTAPPATSEG